MKLQWQPMFPGNPNAHIAEGQDHAYLIRADQEAVYLYQMPKDEPICPINRERATRVEVFPVTKRYRAGLRAQQWETWGNKS